MDALPPEVLSGIIRERFEDIIMLEPLQEVLEQEQQDKASLQAALRSIGRKRK